MRFLKIPMRSHSNSKFEIFGALFREREKKMPLVNNDFQLNSCHYNFILSQNVVFDVFTKENGLLISFCNSQKRMISPSDWLCYDHSSMFPFVDGNECATQATSIDFSSRINESLSRNHCHFHIKNLKTQLPINDVLVKEECLNISLSTLMIL